MIFCSANFSINSLAAEDSLSFGSQGKIVIENEQDKSTDDIIFDSSDFNKIAQTVSDGKVSIANALNNKFGANINTNGSLSFSTLVNTIENGIPSKSAINKTLSVGESVDIPAGYYATAGKVSVKSLSAVLSDATLDNSNKLLSGMVAYGKNGTKYTGTMANNGALNWNPSGSESKTIAAGYYSGGTISTSNAYAQGVTDADNRSNPGCVNYNSGYNAGRTVGQNDVKNNPASYLATQAAQTITPGTANQTISSGKYLTGNQTILGDADLKAEYIKEGVELFGVTGTLNGDTYKATGNFMCSSSVATINVGFKPKMIYVRRGDDTNYPSTGLGVNSSHIWIEGVSATQVLEYANDYKKYNIGARDNGVILSITDTGFTFGTTTGTYGCTYVVYG